MQAGCRNLGCLKAVATGGHEKELEALRKDSVSSYALQHSSAMSRTLVIAVTMTLDHNQQVLIHSFSFGYAFLMLLCLLCPYGSQVEVEPELRILLLLVRLTVPLALWSGRFTTWLAREWPTQSVIS